MAVNQSTKVFLEMTYAVLASEAGCRNGEVLPLRRETILLGGILMSGGGDEFWLVESYMQATPKVRWRSLVICFRLWFGVAVRYEET